MAGNRIWKAGEGDYQGGQHYLSQLTWSLKEAKKVLGH